MQDDPPPQIVASFAELERILEATGLDGIEDAIYARFEFDGFLVEEFGGIEFQFGRRGIILTFPFTLDDVEQVVNELDEGFETDSQELS